MNRRDATPYALPLLAALGARVIKIEDLGGDPWRGMLGGLAGVQSLEGKESLALNLRPAEGREIVDRLVKKADAFVYAYRPGVEKSLGVDYERLNAINPRLNYLSAAGYGSSGPYAARPMYGNTTKAMMGGLYRQAGRWFDPDLAAGRDVEELKKLSKRFATVGPAGGDPESALARATILMMATLHQRRTGRGQYIDTSMVNHNGYANADDFNSRLYPTAEGWVFLACPRATEFREFCSAAGIEELAADPRFAAWEAVHLHSAELAEAIGSHLATRSAADWEALLAPLGIGCVKVGEHGFADFTCTDPVIAAAGLVAEVEDPHFGRYLRHGPPVTFSESSTRLAPACQIGQHTAAILAEVGYSSDQIRELSASGVVGIWEQPALISRDLVTSPSRAKPGTCSQHGADGLNNCRDWAAGLR